MITFLFFALLSSLQLSSVTSLTGNRTYGQCRPQSPDYPAFSFSCPDGKVTWIQDAFFGVTTDGFGPQALSDFCDNAAPNRTLECIPERSINTRDIRLACNTVRGPCNPNGSAEVMHSYTFDNCSSDKKRFTYAYATYDCLPAFRSTDNALIDYVYVNQFSLPRSSYEKFYLMSTGYDSKGYTTSPVNQCSIKATSGALSTVRFTVLDLLGQATTGSTTSCPYTLSISSTGYSKDWCAQPTWNYFDTYVLDIPASSGSQLIVSVNFNAATDSTSPQGRFWILVEGFSTDGITTVSFEIINGLATTTSSSSATTTTTPPVTSTTTTTTTTTIPTTTTTTTSTSATSRAPNSTPRNTPTLTTTSTSVTPTTSSTTTAAVVSSIAAGTPIVTPSSPTTAITVATTAFLSPIDTPTTTTIFTTPPFIATSTTSATTTTTTTAVSLPLNPTSPRLTPTLSNDQSTGYSSVSANSSANGGLASSVVIGIAVGVSVAGVVLLSVSILVVVCLCMYCSRKKRQSNKSRRSDSTTEIISGKEVTHGRSDNANATVTQQISSISGSNPGEDIYSEINESTIGVTIIHTGTMKANDPSTVKHQFRVEYTVGGRNGATSGANRHKIYDVKRIKGRPRQLDEEAWDSPEMDSPPPYSNKEFDEDHRHGTKRSIWEKNQLHIPPGDTGESDTDVQQNPLYGLGLSQKDGKRSEDYNY